MSLELNGLLYMLHISYKNVKKRAIPINPDFLHRVILYHITTLALKKEHFKELI